MPLRSTRPGRYVAIASMAVAVSSLASGAVVLERWLRVGGSSRHDDALRGLDLLTLLGLGGAALVFAVFTGLVRPAIVAWSRRTRTEGEREASVRIDRRYREQLHALGDAMTQMAAVHARSREELGTETEGRVRAIEQHGPFDGGFGVGVTGGTHMCNVAVACSDHHPYHARSNQMVARDRFG